MDERQIKTVIRTVVNSLDQDARLLTMINNAMVKEAGDYNPTLMEAREHVMMALRLLTIF